MQSDIREMSAQALLKMHELTEADLKRVNDFGRIAIPKIDQYLDRFYDWVVDIPEYEILFSSPEIIAHARAQQHLLSLIHI